MDIKVSAQLYTVRDRLAENFESMIDAIAKMGYSAVELAGEYGGKSPAELKEFLAARGLTVSGCHFTKSALDEDFEKCLGICKGVGAKYFICCYNTYAGKDDYLSTAADFVKMSAAAEENGMEFCYHNHDFEFETYGGESGYDILIVNSKGIVTSELDVYWVAMAGLDPVEFINNHKDQISVIHLKDMDASDKSFAPVGTGTLNMAAIIRAGVDAGVECFVVEQDICKTDSLGCLKTSIDNIRVL